MRLLAAVHRSDVRFEVGELLELLSALFADVGLLAGVDEGVAVERGDLTEGLAAVVATEGSFFGVTSLVDLQIRCLFKFENTYKVLQHTFKSVLVWKRSPHSVHKKRRSACLFFSCVFKIVLLAKVLLH